METQCTWEARMNLLEVTDRQMSETRKIDVFKKCTMLPKCNLLCETLYKGISSMRQLRLT